MGQTRGLQQHHQKKTQKFGLPMDAIKNDKIVHRVNKSGKNQTVMKLGPLSLLHSIKSLVVDIILERAAMRQPMRVRKGIAIVNSMLKGTKIKQDLMEYRKNKKLFSSLGGNVGQEYWRAFINRYNEILS
mmetsp:Transcript_28022/g.34110  ORF Transcript_28022/g.34110 Transcript_28022/m.34110 type:complete len:130 (+) Transcript_28022:130-519(+)